jgi:surfactin synthase thioesterase subunit
LSADRLFLVPPPPDSAEVLLFCLPSAGGGASGFWPWRRVLPATVDVQPVQLPGRESRLAEPPGIDEVAIAEAVLARADRPYAVYGHSMGALVWLAVLRHLAGSAGRLPTRFYVAASRPPHERSPWVARLTDLPDARFLAELERLGGIPEFVLADPGLRALLAPVLRADFRWLSTADIPEKPAVPVPLVAFAGDDDPLAGPTVMTGWRRYTDSSFHLHTFPGGHFFPATELQALTARIRADLSARPRPEADTG